MLNPSLNSHTYFTPKSLHSNQILLWQLKYSKECTVNCTSPISSSILFLDNFSANAILWDFTVTNVRFLTFRFFFKLRWFNSCPHLKSNLFWCNFRSLKLFMRTPFKNCLVFSVKSFKNPKWNIPTLWKRPFCSNFAIELDVEQRYALQGVHELPL